MSSNLIILTGSHPSPLEALAAKLILNNYQVKTLTVPTPKFNRHQQIFSLLSLIKLPLSILKAKIQLSQLKPILVVSFGGYQALPVCLAAKLLHLPLLIHEQTFTPGLTTKLTSLIANKIAVSWPQNLKSFSAKKTFLTGNPLRQEILTISRQSHPSLTIYITGGHFGSKVINQALEPILPKLLAHYTIYHQFGLNQTDKPPVLKHPHYHLKTWFKPNELKKIYSSADLIVSRSGINTVCELAYLKIPAVLIPLETSQKNEQLTNARFLESLGLGLILKQSKLDPQTLLSTINQALKILPQPARINFDQKLLTQATAKLVNLVHETKTN